MADNINLSPDMIENLVDMLKNSGFNNNINNDNSTNSENCNSATFSEILKNLSSNGGNVEKSSNSDNEPPLGNLDFETIIKIKSIIETLNNVNDQDSQLLYSLKPYLRKSRQAKLDQYINILRISQVSKIFKKGDST